MITRAVCGDYSVITDVVPAQFTDACRVRLTELETVARKTRVCDAHLGTVAHIAHGRTGKRQVVFRLIDLGFGDHCKLGCKRV